MNNLDPFEKRLAETPPRTIPAGWREQLLRNCANTAGEAPVRDQRAALQPDEPLEGGILAVLREWLWPHPAAWAALGVAWVGIIGLSISADVTPVSFARGTAAAPPSPEYLALLREQRELLRSLVAEPRPPVAPAGHDERKPSVWWFRREGAGAIT